MRSKYAVCADGWIYLFSTKATHPDSSYQLCKSHMAQNHWSYSKLEYHWGFFEGILQPLWQEYWPCSSCSVPSKYPQQYFNCSSLKGTASYETYVAGQEEGGCVGVDDDFGRHSAQVVHFFHHVIGTNTLGDMCNILIKWCYCYYYFFFKFCFVLGTVIIVTTQYLRIGVIVVTKFTESVWYMNLLIHIKIPPTGHVGLILRSTAVATVSRGTIEDTIRVPDATVTGGWEATTYAGAAEYPHSTLNGTVTYSSHSSKCVIWEPHSRLEESECVGIDTQWCIVSEMCVNS